MAVTRQDPKLFLTVIPEDGDCEVFTIDPRSTKTLESGYSNGYEFRTDWCAGYDSARVAASHGWFPAVRHAYEFIEFTEVIP